MSTTRLFVPAGLKIGATYLPHCGEQSIEQGLEELHVFPSGDWAPNLTGSKAWSPTWSIESHDVAAALDLMTANHLARSCLLDDVRIFQRKVDDMGFQGAVASGVHQVFQLLSNAFLYWDTLSASQADEASKLALKLVATTRNANPPLVALGPTTIDAPGAQNSPFTLGPVVINGTTLGGVGQWSWANNIQVQKIMSDGEASPSFAAITQVRPVITFDTTDLQTICATDPDGSEVTSLICYLRRRRPNKTLWADAEARHVKLYTPTIVTGNVGTLKWTKIGGSPAKVSCEIALHRNTPTAVLFDYASGVAIV